MFKRKKANDWKKGTWQTSHCHFVFLFSLHRCENEKVVHENEEKRHIFKLKSLKGLNRGLNDVFLKGYIFRKKVSISSRKILNICRCVFWIVCLVVTKHKCGQLKNYWFKESSFPSFITFLSNFHLKSM